MNETSESIEKPEIEVQHKNESKNEGLQNNGSVIVDEKNDFALHYFDQIDAWQTAIQTSTGHSPWLSADDFSRSYAMKHLNFESEPEYVDNSNLYQSQMDAATAKRVTQKRNLQQRRRDEVTLDHVTEGVRELNREDTDQANDDEEDEPFLDEYGEVIDNEVIDNRSKQSCEKTKSSNRDDPDSDESKRARNHEQPKSIRQRSAAKRQQRTAADEPVGNSGPAQKERTKKWTDLDAVSDSQKTNLNRSKRVKRDNRSCSEPSVGGRCSALSADEQLCYLGLLEKFNHRNMNVNSLTTNADWEQYRAFQDFNQGVSEERGEYQRVAQSLAQSRQAAYLHLSPDIKEYVDEYLNYQRKRLKQYGRYYVKHPTEARLRPVITEQSRSLHQQSHYEMVEDCLLLQFGVIPKLLTPTWTRIQDSKLSINKEITKLKERLRQKNPKNELHKDPNAEKIAKSPLMPQIIATMSAIKTIYNSHLSEGNKWTIPVVVRQFDKHKVVFVEKPFVNEDLSVEEKKAIFYGKASKSFLTHPWTTSNSNQRSKQESTEDTITPSPDDPFDESNVGISTLESFGDTVESGEQPLRKSMRIRQRQIKQVDGHDDDDDDKALRIDLSESSNVECSVNGDDTRHDSRVAPPSQGQDRQEKLQESQAPHDRSVAVPDKETFLRGESEEKGCKTQPSEKGLLDSLLKATSGLLKPRQDSTSTMKNKSAFFSDPSASETNKYTRYKGEALHFVHSSLDPQSGNGHSPNDYKNTENNVVYRLWNLRDRAAPGPSNIRVVVRGSENGIRHQKRSITGEKGAVTQSFTVSSKLEHVSEMGCECTSIAETTRDWMATLLRPQSHLARLRVDVVNGSVCMCQFQTLKDVTREALSRFNLRPAEQLGALHAAMKSLLQLEEGEYLIRHDSKTGAFATILKAVESPSDLTLDLHRLYEDSKVDSEREASVTVNPIDVQLITPWHKRVGRVPGLFAPFEIKTRLSV